MTKLFRDVDYYVVQASNSTQREFELDFADIIEVFGLNETTITTECGRTVIINWYASGLFQSYHVIYETAQMESSINRTYINDIINKLRTIDVDGETMQYIIEKVGMTDQMLKQLVMNSPYTDTSDLLEEKVRLSDEYLRSLAKNNR
jgi:hypothetical protein